MLTGTHLEVTGPTPSGNCTSAGFLVVAPSKMSGSFQAPGSRARVSLPTAFHGSTLRFYDPKLGTWRSTWIEPINGRVRLFVGRPTGGDIELISFDGDPLLRWRFTEIQPDSFWWIGECSTDETRTWRIEERMYCTRAR